MKNLKKTFGVVLTSAILAVGLAVSASAQTFTGGALCSGGGLGRFAALRSANNILSTCVTGSSKAACGSDKASVSGKQSAACPTGQSSGNALPDYVSTLLKQCGLDLGALGAAKPSCGNTANSNCGNAANGNTNCDKTANCNSNPGNAANCSPKCSQSANCAPNCGTGKDCAPNCGGTDKTPGQSGGGSQTPPSSGGNGSGTSGDSKADNQSFEERVAELVNQQRAANGLKPVTLSAELSKAARAKSQDMHDNRYFAHESPTYGSPFDMLKSFGISYRTAGENIAMGYATPEAVMNAWMNSTGHRANILNASYTQIGVGYVADGSYWTQEFTG